MYITKCEMCGKHFKLRKYTYRVSIEQLDVEEFRPFSRLAADLCYRCNKKVEEFIFGKPEENEEIDMTNIDVH